MNQTDPKALQNPRAIALLLALGALGLAHLLASFVDVPLLCFAPRSGAWHFGLPRAGEPTVKYYGLILYAAGAWLVGYLVGRLPAVSRALQPPRRAHVLVYATVTITIVALLNIAIAELVDWGSR